MQLSVGRISSSNNISRPVNTSTAITPFNKRAVSSMTFKEENLTSYTDANGVLYKVSG